MFYLFLQKILCHGILNDLIYDNWDDTKKFDR